MTLFEAMCQCVMLKGGWSLPSGNSKGNHPFEVGCARLTVVETLVPGDPCSGRHRDRNLDALAFEDFAHQISAGFGKIVVATSHYGAPQGPRG